jgi:crotonobetainyl-CoA:carnitine CoA-transferase CaiB-like acyl-CoA transferase
MSGPLKGIRVLDLTSVLMGPYCTMLLGDLGADVIKVESKRGDTLRYLGPAQNKAMGSLYLQLGRNKKSIVLDLKSQRGKEVLLRLARDVDVFVHSMRPQAIDKLGLSYEEINKVNENIIYCATYGFSKDGPYATKPAYDDIIQGASGLVASQEAMTGTPQYMATVLADKTTGIMASNAIMAALFYRLQTGEGQNIEVPMFETMVSYNMIEHLYGLAFEPPLGNSFYPRVISKFRKPYKTKDGHICVMVYNDNHWKSFFEVTGNQYMLEDPRFKDITTRTKHINEIYQMIEEIILTKTSEKWLSILAEADIPAMPVNKPEDLLKDPHLKEIGFFREVDHPTEGKIINMAFPVNFSKTKAEIKNFAPRLGEDSISILENFGYSTNDIKAMIEEGIIVDGKELYSSK